MTLFWYHWAIFGVVMMLSELVVPTLVLVWFGLGALAPAILLALLPDASLTLQLFVWGLLSLVLVFLWFRVLLPMRDKTKSGSSSAEAVGEVGILVNDVDAFQKGKVRFQRPIIGAEQWDCIADTAIKAGTRVKVASVEGSLLKITQA